MRILFVTTRPPWPPRRGDQARVAGWVRELGERHEISVLSQRPPGFPIGAPQHGVRLSEQALGRGRILRSLVQGVRMPLQVAWHFQPALAARVRREIDEFRPDVAVVVLSRLGWLEEALKGVPLVVDLVDSLALNMQRRARRQAALASFWNLEGRRIAAWDQRWVASAACGLVVSERDRDAVIAGAPAIASRMQVVPFGIPLGSRPQSRPRDEPVVLLSGNLGYFPTVEGALWLGREVWPKVREQVPAARWLLAGSRMAPAVRRLARLPGVLLLEDPEDLSAVRQRSSVAVAPMRSGSGTPIKVLEAMADGLPVVATEEAAHGLDGLTGSELSVGRDADSFTRALVRLLADPEEARKQAVAARDWLEGHHDLSRIARRFEEILGTVVDRGSTS